jgi:chemotaxis protein methyltransferase CheR
MRVDGMDISDREFGLLKDYLFRESGIDVAEEKRYLFTTRLSELLIREGCKTFSEFYRVLASGIRDHLTQQVIELMTTHESGFFRDQHPYQVFTDVVLPEASDRRAGQAHFLPPRLRILSAGCSFGQEPYSIALCIRRWLPTQSVFSLQDISIVGVDISDKTIERAKTGIFSEMELGKQLSAPDRQNYFRISGKRWQLLEDIRKMVVFQRVNLMESFDNIGKFDVVFCRNVIIYFSIEGRKTVLGRLRRALEPEGVLFLGSAESLYTLSDDFSSRTEGLTTFYINKGRQS